MNHLSSEIMNYLAQKPFVNQRVLAQETKISLGAVNRTLRELTQLGYLDPSMVLTAKAWDAYRENSPKNAVILAAGFGMRMVPINTQTTKGLLEINGEPMIERQIRHLHEAGVREIYVVVGFMKEHYEYLMDKYGVELIVNPAYAAKNNLHSLKLAAKHLSNTYIVPCDIWCRENPFRVRELGSWYMMTEQTNPESQVRYNRKMELVSVSKGTAGNTMVGIAYLTQKDAQIVRARMQQFCADANMDQAFWEETLYCGDKLILPARVLPAGQVVEINTYEQLRELDRHSSQLRSEAIEDIARAMGVSVHDIREITVLKKGMTNRSFLFSCKGVRYVMRIPGEGTDQLINRREEAAVYHTIDGQNICDDIAYINPENGNKITRFWEDARVCDPDNVQDLKICMKKLREFHELGIQVEHTFDIFQKIDFYESLWNGIPSVYRDYENTKRMVLQLKPYIDTHAAPYVLTHIDAVPDNFLFIGSSGQEQVRLIDWEYAGMQDPHVDIAMFCIYALYDRAQVEQLIDLYFPEGCYRETRIKIYCYIAACGLLWSNWCEFKRNLGVEFGEYSIRQYRYAKDYCRIVRDLMEQD